MRLQKLSDLKTHDAELTGANSFVDKKNVTWTTGIMLLALTAKGKQQEYKFFERGVFVDGTLKVEMNGKVFCNIYQGRKATK